jgi:hypothetical protein
MIVRTFSRHAYGITIAILVAGICALAAFLILVALPEMGGLTAVTGPSATPAPSTAPSATPGSGMALSPIGIEMPKDANCEGCHLTTTGTVGTRTIPKLGHPLWGFRECTACHARDALVEAAPGHSSLHTQDCLVCHQVNPDLASGTTVAPMRPEHMGGDKPCTSCHGVDDHAPMPDSMANRENCWVCHNGSEFTYLFESASPGASPASSPTAAPDGASTGATGANTGATWALTQP